LLRAPSEVEIEKDNNGGMVLGRGRRKMWFVGVVGKCWVVGVIEKWFWKGG